MGPKPKVWCVIIVVVVVLFQYHSVCEACWEKERFALLQMKSSFNITHRDSWVEGNISSDCCDWGGVECDKTTGRVIALNLHNMTDIPTGYRWYLNASYFAVFEHLQTLILRDNMLYGIVEFEGLWKLKKLEELDLSKNNLEGEIPLFLRNMTSLKLLDLSSNHLSGNVALSSIPHLTSLVLLEISNNNLQIPFSFQSFANHSKLKIFISKENELIPEPDHFEIRPPKFQPQVLSLSGCRFVGLNATFPTFLYHQNDLRVVDLSHIRLGGNFPSWLLKNNTKLKMISLRNNSFIGPFNLPWHPCPDVVRINVAYNNLHGQIPANLSFIFPNLLVLVMASNDFKGNIPPGLASLTSLRFLDLSHNQLSGGLPEQMDLGNTSLQVLKLSYNNLDGQICPRFCNSTTLRYFYLAGNKFVGNMPDLSSIWLSWLDMSDNHLSGKLPGWIGNMSLTGINLSSNHFEGSIPREFCRLDSLEFIDISENNLSGSVPSCFSPTRVEHVHLYNNHLKGPMTNAFNESSSLVTLDLNHNDLTGTIPTWLGNLPSLSILFLQHNRFYGNIPIQFCQMTQLTMLDLSHNNLSGSVPSCLSNLTFTLDEQYSKSTKSNPGTFFGSDYAGSTVLLFQIFRSVMLHTQFDIVYVRLLITELEKDASPETDQPHSVDFTTKRMSLTYKGFILDSMSGIDLSSNQLSGKIPSEFGNLSNIRALNLSHNNFTGSIPATFSNLKQTESLDLSYNNLNGMIPHQMTELNSLAVFNVSYNNLSGAVPERKNQFGTFDESSYEGNLFLCGPPLPKKCGETDESPSPFPNDDDQSEDNGFIDMDDFYVSLLASYTVVLLGFLAVLCINPQWRQAWFYFIEDCITTCYIFYKRCV